MLKYQIEYTIYETKSKLLQKQKSNTYSSDSPEPEIEIPLELTYSENGMYSKLSPNSVVNGQNPFKDQDTGSKSAQYYDQNQEEGYNQDTIRLKDEEKVDDRGTQHFKKNSRNVSGSGKKFMSHEENMHLNINTGNNSDIKKMKSQSGRSFTKSVAQKYLDMKNQFRPAVNPKSKELAKFKNTEQEQAYDRLHAQAHDKQQLELKVYQKEKKKSREVIAAKDKPGFTSCNAGERLYQRSRVNKEKASRKALKEQKQKELESGLGGTFKPKINEMSHKFYKRSYKEQIPDSLNQVKAKVDEELQKKREEYQKKLDEENTFTPQLSKVTMEISDRKIKRDTTVHDELFVNAVMKRNRYDAEFAKWERESPKKLSK